MYPPATAKVFCEQLDAVISRRSTSSLTLFFHHVEDHFETATRNRETQLAFRSHTGTATGLPLAPGPSPFTNRVFGRAPSHGPQPRTGHFGHRGPVSQTHARSGPSSGGTRDKDNIRQPAYHRPSSGTPRLHALGEDPLASDLAELDTSPGFSEEYDEGFLFPIDDRRENLNYDTEGLSSSVCESFYDLEEPSPLSGEKTDDALVT